MYCVKLETSSFEEEELQNFLKFNRIRTAETPDKSGQFPVYEYRSISRLTLVKMILTFWQSGNDETDQEAIDSIEEIKEKKFHVEIMDMPHGKFIHSRVDGNVIGNFSISEARELGSLLIEKANEWMNSELQRGERR